MVDGSGRKKTGCICFFLLLLRSLSLSWLVFVSNFLRKWNTEIVFTEGRQFTHYLVIAFDLKKHVFAENVQRTLIEIQSLCCFNCWSLLFKWFTSHNFTICQKNRDEKYIRFSIWNNTQKNSTEKKNSWNIFFFNSKNLLHICGFWMVSRMNWVTVI